MKDAGTIVSMDSGLSVADQSRGLDWAHWLLRSVRQRCDGVLLDKLDCKTTAQASWRTFVRDRFLPVFGPALLQAWRLAEDRDVEALVRFDLAHSQTLTVAEDERSTHAAGVLLARTRGARYQGPLGHYRTAVAEGRAAGHMVIVWAAVAHLFQLTPSILIAEYLRLEWETATRDLAGVPMPFGAAAIDQVVMETLKHLQSEPSLLTRKEA